jgi:glycosyltransferase involved in cell wall biosynthesis
MKVIHLIAGNSDGGAASGALNLHKQLISYGVDSVVLLGGKVCEPLPNTYAFQPGACSRLGFGIKSIFSKVLLKLLYPRRRDIFFSTGFEGFTLSKYNLITQADIVHIHWISGFMPISEFKKIRAPILMTVRDMWLFTGGCHYALDCNKYQTFCGSCPLLGSSWNFDLSRWLTWRKIRTLPPTINLVFISNWLQKVFLESSLCKQLPSLNYSVIHNTIDQDLYAKPNAADFSFLRHHCIDETKKIIICGAVNISDPWKGIDFICNSIAKLSRNITDQFVLGIFGGGDHPSLAGLPVRVIRFGKLKSSQMSALYRKSFLYVHGSTYEAFGKTVAEAMLCGLPVIGFPGVGSSELIEDGATGFLAESISALGLAKAITKYFLLSESSRRDMKVAANLRILQRYNSKEAVSKYVSLYESLINS